MKDREKKFAAGGVPKTYDGKPLRLIEVAFNVTPEQKEVADLYYRARQSAIWRTDFYWTLGNQNGKPRLPCYATGGAEHCISFMTASQTEYHLWAIQGQLYNSVGIHEDIPKWLEKPEVKEFQAAARRKILATKFSDSNPEDWAKLSSATLMDADLPKILEPVIPKNLTPEQKDMLVSFTFADRAIRDYQKLMGELGVREDHLLNFNNPNAKAIFVYEGSDAAPAFDSGQYEYSGTVYGLKNAGTQRPFNR